MSDDCNIHRGPEGPNEDIAQCRTCYGISYAMRPENEQYALHLKDCSLPQRHESYCEPGGNGHPPAENVRGYWPTYEADVQAERDRFAQENNNE